MSRVPHLILQALITLGESLYPFDVRLQEDVYYRAAFDEIIRREWGAEHLTDRRPGPPCAESGPRR
jgi:hypothetical protein